MDLNKKEIIYELAKGVHSQVKAQAYGFIRRKLADKQGVSEIALYSAVAEHLEENDIHPSKYINEMIALIEGVSENLFMIKTDDKFSYLRSSFSAINLENSPESKGQFLCSKCYTIKQPKDLSPHKNYKHTCEPCYRDESKASAKRYQKKIKEQPPKVPIPNREPNPAMEQQAQPQNLATEPATAPPATITPEPTFELANINPFLEIESITGDSSATIVSVSCDTSALLKMLQILDPYVVPTKKEEPKAQEPKEDKQEEEQEE